MYKTYYLLITIITIMMMMIIVIITSKYKLNIFLTHHNNPHNQIEFLQFKNITLTSFRYTRLLFNNSNYYYYYYYYYYYLINNMEWIGREELRRKIKL